MVSPFYRYFIPHLHQSIRLLHPYYAHEGIKIIATGLPQAGRVAVFARLDLLNDARSGKGLGAGTRRKNSQHCQGCQAGQNEGRKGFITHKVVIDSRRYAGCEALNIKFVSTK